MKWFEYKREVDALHASDALKERLLALQSGSSASLAEGTSSGQEDSRRSAVSYPKAAGAASCGGAKSNAFSARAAAYTRQKRKAPISWRRMAALAACFVFGVLACDAFGWNVLPRMGSSNAFLDTTSDKSSTGSTYDTYSYNTAATEQDGMADTVSDTSEDSAAADWAQNDTDLPAQYAADASRKIIYNASLSLESKDYEATLAALRQAVSAAGGYIESSDESAYTADARSCSVTCRIPADAYADFLTAAANTGSMMSKSQSAQDVTSDYVDIAARIQALETQRDRLLALEQQAETLSDLLQIEDSLSNVQYELENYQAQQKVYDDQIAYSTVTVEVQEVASYTPVETGFWQRLGEALSRALISFGSTLAELVFWLAGLWPWLVLLAAVAGSVWLVKRIRRKK